MSAEVVVQSVAFRPDDYVEITYTEERDLTDHVGLVKTVMFQRDVLRSAVEELEDDLRDLIDAALVALRNPPAKVRPASRDDEDDDD